MGSDRLDQLRLVQRRGARDDPDNAGMLVGSDSRRIELLDTLQVSHGPADNHVPILLQIILAYRKSGNCGAGPDPVARGDHRAQFIVLGKEAELVGKIGDIDLLLPEHLQQTGLRHMDGPLHILGRIEARLGKRESDIVLVDAAESPDADAFTPELAEIPQRSNPLIIHLLGDAGDGIAETQTIISTVENDYERRTLGHAVE